LVAWLAAILIVLAGLGVHWLVQGGLEPLNVPITVVTILLAIYVLLASRWRISGIGPWSCGWASSTGSKGRACSSSFRSLRASPDRGHAHPGHGFQLGIDLTKDTVPVNVDAICFWMAWDAKKAVLEVQSFYQAIILSAQTALRDIIGTHELADMLTHRGELGRRLREILDEKTNPWASASNPSRFATSSSPGIWKRPCPSRPRPSASARRESS